MSKVSRISDKVLRHTYTRYRALGSYAAVGTELGLSQSAVHKRIVLAVERGLIHPKAPKNAGTPDLILTNTFALFEKFGRSGLRAAKALGVSRTVVYRRLDEGERRGLFTWRPLRNQHTDSKIVEVVARSRTVRGAAKRLGLTDTHLHHLLTERDLRDAVEIVKEHLREEGDLDPAFISEALRRNLVKRSR